MLKCRVCGTGIVTDQSDLTCPMCGSTIARFIESGCTYDKITKNPGVVVLRSACYFQDDGRRFYPKDLDRFAKRQMLHELMECRDLDDFIDFRVIEYFDEQTGAPALKYSMHLRMVPKDYAFGENDAVRYGMEDYMQNVFGRRIDGNGEKDNPLGALAGTSPA